MASIDDDTVAVLKKRVYDMAGTVKDIKVYLNDQLIKVKGFKQYVDMYVSSASSETTDGGAAKAKPSVIYERVDERWEVAFAVSDASSRQCSSLRGITIARLGNADRRADATDAAGPARLWGCCGLGERPHRPVAPSSGGPRAAVNPFTLPRLCASTPIPTAAETLEAGQTGPQCRPAWRFGSSGQRRELSLVRCE